MADITKKVDRAVPDTDRYQYWASSENADDGTAIAAADIFKIQESLGRPARYFYIETTAGTTLTIRINSQVTIYPLRAPIVNYPRRPAIESGVTFTDESRAAIPISDGTSAEVWEFDGIIPIKDIQLVTFSGGSFELFVA